MSNGRKVQGEIDRLLKKINEGMEVYEEVYEKFQGANSQALKERFEADLKKEIKKLQRLREQIKTLLQGSEVKDKKSLEKARRDIEIKMEGFKVCERETKTKAFSKEGLAGNAPTNPQDAAKYATSSWIKDAISELGEQLESLEFDIENEGGGRRKKGVDPREERLARSKYHEAKLQQLLRLLDNDELSPEDIDAVQDDVQAYVEGNTDEDYVEEFEELYDCFDLPEATAGDSDEEPEQVKSTPKIRAAEEAKKAETAGGRVVQPTKDTPPTTPLKATPKTAKEPAAAPAKKAPPPAAVAPVKTPATKTATPASKPAAVGAKTPATPASPSREAPMPADNQPKVNYAAVVQQHSSSNNNSAVAAAKAADGPTLESLMDDDADGLNDDTFGDDAMSMGGTGSLADMAMMTGGGWEKQQAPARPTPPSAADARPTPIADAFGSLGAPPAVAPLAAAPLATPSLAAPPVQPAAAQVLPPTSGQSHAHMAAVQMLEQSARNLPHPNDCERLKAYIPPNPYKTPAWYPQTIHPSLSNADTMSKFEIEALFFIFYYQPNTYQQYLAAKELKRQSWRYHKRYLTWFQRHDTPKNTTDEFEQGAYIYFDYESGWCQRIKNDFTFKYQYLEDELV